MVPGLVVVGVDVGQKVDPTALVVCEVERRVVAPARSVLPAGPGAFTGADVRRVPAQVEVVYIARHVERLVLGTAYPAVAKHVAGVVTGLGRRGVVRPRLMVDATGVGTPVVELIAEALGPGRRDLLAATFTHGDKYSQDDRARTASVGKAYLVSRLQALLQTGRLKLPKTPEAEALGRELADYEIKVDQDANDKYGAFKVGTHDDLVTALGLCVVYRQPTPGRMVTFGSLEGLGR